MKTLALILLGFPVAFAQEKRPAEPAAETAAKPVLPMGSSREPTLYQRFTATTGVPWSGLTMTRSPLARVTA